MYHELRKRGTSATDLFCFGLGYTARHFVAEFADRFDPIAGTVRDRDAAVRIAREGIAGKEIAALAFDGAAAAPEIAARLAASDAVLVSVPPDGAGDPVLRCCAAALAAAPRLHTIVYLSTIGVYGDHGGGWVDEGSAVDAASERSRARLDAERGWTALAARAGRALAILRLSGIYGPGRNALVQVANATARRIVKPGQVFNRIHVSDIAQAISAALARRSDGVFNVTDDEATPPGEPILFAADLLGVPPPPEVPFERAAATMTPLALSFYAESRRVHNDKMKRELGVRLRYPTYREGLRALLVAGEGVRATVPQTRA